MIDYTIFYKHSRDRKVVLLIVYVDDIILTRDDIFELDKLKEVLAHEFEIKELHPLKYFMGMEFTTSKKSVFITQ